jgi:signal transduction histidine kinase
MPDIELPAEERLDFSQRIQENIRLLTKIIDELILITDLESSTELPPSEVCFASAMVVEAIDSTRSLAAPTVQFRQQCTIADDQPIMSHPRMIHIILEKLLDNAAKFTHEGSITLSVEQEENRIHIAVADTGPGIPADKKDCIFERFSKLDSFTQGTGLGLSVARMIAERLGGTLTLDTSYQGGSKFDLFIPITPQA